MGINSFLEKNIHIGAQFPSPKITGKIELFRDGKLIPIKLKKVEKIHVSVASWSHAYHIHYWFIKNRICPNDQSQGFDVPRDKVAELLDICIKIKENPDKAKDLLPIDKDYKEDYDKDYFDTLDYTIKILNEALKDEESRWYWYEYL